MSLLKIVRYLFQKNLNNDFSAFVKTELPTKKNNESINFHL